MLDRLPLRLNSGYSTSAVEYPDLSIADGQAYRLEMRSDTGGWLGDILGWYNGRRSAEYNAHEILTFNLAADNPAIDVLDQAVEVWLYRGGYTSAWARYQIASLRHVVGETRSFVVQCFSPLYRLAIEPITNYAAEGNPLTENGEPTPITVRSALSALLAMQTQQPRIRLGIIDGAIGNALIQMERTGQTILEWLQEIRKIVGGFFEVDTSLHLNWRTLPSDLEHARTGNWIRPGYNLIEIDQCVDYMTGYANRVTAIGNGATFATSITVTLNDTAAQAVAGKIVAAVVTDKTISDIDTLTTWAQAELDSRKVPRTTHKSKTVDLGSLSSNAYKWTQGGLEIGSEVRVICDYPEIDYTAYVLSISTNLDDPLDTQIELGQIDTIAPLRAGLVDKVVELTKRIKVLEGTTGAIRSIERIIAAPAEEILTERDLAATALDRYETIPADADAWDDLIAQSVGSGTLPADVAALQGDVADLESALSALEGRVAALEELDLSNLAHMFVVEDREDLPETSEIIDSYFGYATTTKQLFIRSDNHWQLLLPVVDGYELKADLPDGIEGQHALTLGDGNEIGPREYVWIDGAWVCASHLEEE